MPGGESVRRRDAESPRSTLLFHAQARSYGQKIHHLQVKKSPEMKANVIGGVYTSMPMYSSPKKQKPKNPFNDVLPHQFEAPTCSPTIFATIISPSELRKTGEFLWTIEDVSRINPATIDSPPTDAEENMDEEMESSTQEAIERYFKESHYIPSPDLPAKIPPHCVTMRGDDSYLEDSLCLPPAIKECAMSTPCSRYESRRIARTATTATQTILSLPPFLPQEVAKVLEPYFMTEEDEPSDCNTSSSSLRRKLCFNDALESPINSDNDFDEKAPSLPRFPASDWTPDKANNAESVSSPELSPINCTENNLDFTRDMSVDSFYSKGEN